MYRTIRALCATTITCAFLACGGSSDSTASGGGSGGTGSGGTTTTTSTSTVTQVTCPMGFGNCNDDSADGCEADFSKDGSNCGTCGNNCGAGQCSAGACGPKTIISYGGAYDCVNDGSTLFYVNRDVEVYRIVDDGAQILLAKSEPQSPPSIAIDDTTVFWSAIVAAQGAGIGSVPRTGGTATFLAIQIDELTNALALDNEHVYWTTLRISSDGLGSLFKIQKDGSGQIVELNKASPPGFKDYFEAVVDDTNVYWYAQAKLRTISKSGGAAQSLVDLTSGVRIHCLRADNETLFWADFDGVLWRRSKLVGPAEKLGATIGNCNELAVDDSYVYVGDDSGHLTRFDKANGDTHILSEEANEVGCVTANGPYLFWSVYPADGAALGVIKRSVK